MATDITKSTYTLRFNGKCRACKKAHSSSGRFELTTERSADTFKVLGRRERTLEPVATIECCGRRVSLLPVKGHRRADIACGPKCTEATGHVCECACGGRNHGAGHDTLAIVEVA